MSLTECMRQTTYRQFLVWCQWMIEDLNTPSRSDYHVMRVAMAVHEVNSKDPKSLKVDQFKVGFEQKAVKVVTEEERELHKKYVKAVAKAKAMQAVGMRAEPDGN